MAVVSMSKQEFSRLEVLLRVQSGRLRVSDACALIGLRRRQVFRLLRGLKQDGDVVEDLGLVDRRGVERRPRLRRHPGDHGGIRRRPHQLGKHIGVQNHHYASSGGSRTGTGG